MNFATDNPIRLLAALTLVDLTKARENSGNRKGGKYVHRVDIYTSQVRTRKALADLMLLYLTDAVVADQ